MQVRLPRSPGVLAAMALLVLALIAQSFSGIKGSSVTAVAGFVSPQICPPAANSGVSNVSTSNVVSAGGDDATVRAFTATAKPLLQSLSAVRSLRVQTPVSISGREQSALITSSRVQVWIAAQYCQAPSIDTWFVGGSGAVDSQSRLTLINDGATDATVEVSAWTSNGAVTPVTLAVSARASEVISVDRFALGSTDVALRVRALSGRVTASLFDVRNRGLTPLGGDYVPQGVEPRERQVLVGVVGGVQGARLRLLTSGNEDGLARVDLIVGEDRFTPSGLNEINLPAGRVVDLPVPLKAVEGVGALVIEANVPIVAGLYQPSPKGKEFAWVASSPALSSSALAIPTQFNSTMVLVAPDRSTSLNSTGIVRRALPPIALRESTITTVALDRARWLAANDQVYAAVVVRDGSGVTVMPVAPLSRSRARIQPLPDISVITPR